MSDNQKPVLVYTTFETLEEARKVSRAVVMQKLAACANIIPSMTAIYEWKDEIQEAAEVVVILKTVRAQLPALFKKVLEQHSYDTPALLAIAPESTDPEFANWLAVQTGNSSQEQKEKAD